MNKEKSERRAYLEHAKKDGRYVVIFRYEWGEKIECTASWLSLCSACDACDRWEERGILPDREWWI